MDEERFDHLTPACAPTDTRRRLLRLLTALPLGAALLARGGAEIASADPGDPEHGSSHRRHRRKARHDPGKDKKHRKGKRKGKRKEKKSTGTAPSAPAQLPPTLPPTRKVVTQTFANTSSIAIPASGSVGPANPYPSTLAVSGLPNGTITTIKVHLTGFSHPFPDDVDILLVAPTGTDALIMSDVGGSIEVNAIDLVLDDAATAPLPNFFPPLSSGSFQPTNYRGNDGDVDTFPAPAPAPTGTPLRTFAGQNPNGTWQLFVRDDNSEDTGSLASWGLEITAEVDA